MFNLPHRKRLKHYDLCGHAHFLTFSCFQRQSFLTRPRVCHWLADAIATARQKHAFELWAYVFMPEHVHLVLLPRRRDYAMRAILSSIKLPATKRAVAFLRQAQPAALEKLADRQPNGKLAYRLWQRGGGYDRNLTTPKYIREKIHYIHRNPVERGLAERPQDWYWSSAAQFQGRAGPIELQLEFLREIW